MTNRRTFLTQAAMVSAGIMIAPKMVLARHKDVVGLQLWSVRDYIGTDVSGVIAKVATAGYKQVEPFGYSKEKGFRGLDAKAFSELLKSNGLSTPSGHFEFDSYLKSGKTEEFESYMEAANITGMEYVIVPHLNGDYIKTVDDFKNIADKLNKAGEMCKTAGLKLGYHNHNFEWKPVGGTTFYDTILNETDPKLVNMQMDLYWVVRSGNDPVAIIKAHPGRFFAFHIKDMAKDNHNLNTEIGNGTIDFVTIMSYAKLAGVKYFIMEQENFTNIDPYVSITKSCDYIKNTLHV